nr:hypothetical protein HUO10_000979 [Paraburkholderia busanensis]
MWLIVAAGFTKFIAHVAHQGTPWGRFLASPRIG